MPGQLFLPTVWGTYRLGTVAGGVVIKSWPAELMTMDKGEGLAPKREECTRQTIQEGCLISEYANGHSGDQWPHQKEVD